MTYYDPIPYVLPDEDELEESIEENHVRQISIERRDFPQYGSRCIYFYFYFAGQLGDRYEFDLTLRRDSIGEVSWSVNSLSFLLAGLSEAKLMSWILQAAELALDNFDFYWAASPHEWNLPPSPVDCRIVIS